MKIWECMTDTYSGNNARSCTEPDNHVDFYNSEPWQCWKQLYKTNYYAEPTKELFEHVEPYRLKYTMVKADPKTMDPEHPHTFDLGYTYKNDSGTIMFVHINPNIVSPRYHNKFRSEIEDERIIQEYPLCVNHNVRT